MLQREVAEQIGVCEPSVFNWEANTSQPDFRYMPAIIDFLGYDPLPPANTLAGQLVRQRTSLGLSQKESAERLGVDPTTLARWERGEREPKGEFAKRAERFLVGEEVSRVAVAMGTTELRYTPQSSGLTGQTPR
jgi:transcriptional regulator with XRE-family HTH domain